MRFFWCSYWYQNSIFRVLVTNEPGRSLPRTVWFGICQRLKKRQLYFSRIRGCCPQGTSRHHLQSYLVEHMWRAAVKAEGKPPFNAINDILRSWYKILSCNFTIFLIKYYNFHDVLFYWLILSKVWAISLHIRGGGRVGMGVHYIKYII